MLRRMGDRAVLVECEDASDARRHASALSRDPVLGAEDVVPAARTVLVIFRHPAPAADHLRAVRDRIETAPKTGRDADGPLVTLPVRYDGPDLEAIAELTSRTVDEVVHRHTAATYTVAFVGFVPGFAYLSGLDPALAVPRRSDPRTRTPAGSVAVAGLMAAVYPRSSPGGWRLLGTTDVPLFDVTRDPPALLTGGTRVQFVAR